MSQPVLAIDIVCIDDALEALAIRSVLERWGAKVTLHLVGQAADIVRILGGAEVISKHIILSCHGDERGLLLPELASSVEETQPYHKVLTAANLREFLRLPDCLVINTGCSLGTPEFAAAFLESGCEKYIGAADYPEGDWTLFYVLRFFYELLCYNRDAKEAHQRAYIKDETGAFTLYSR